MTDRDRKQRLARVRDAQEQGARGTWATAEARAQDARERANRLEDTLTRARAELDALLRARALSDSERQSYETPLEVIQGHLEVARAEVEVRLREAAVEQGAWSERRREKRAADRLAERAVDRERSEAAAAEERQAEDQEAERQRWRRGAGGDLSA
ncbi:MAG: hypothetical protein AAFZ65_14650 [Planctomycetota bacterium]